MDDDRLKQDRFFVSVRKLLKRSPRVNVSAFLRYAGLVKDYVQLRIQDRILPTYSLKVKKKASSLPSPSGPLSLPSPARPFFGKPPNGL